MRLFIFQIFQRRQLKSVQPTTSETTQPGPAKVPEALLLSWYRRGLEVGYTRARNEETYLRARREKFSQQVARTPGEPQEMVRNGALARAYHQTHPNVIHGPWQPPARPKPRQKDPQSVQEIHAHAPTRTEIPVLKDWPDAG